MKACIKGQLAALDSDRQTSLKQKLQDLLRVGCEQFGMEMGIFARITGNAYTVMQIHNDSAAKVKPGDTFDLRSTFCMLVCATRDMVCQADVRNSEWSDHPAYRDSLLGAYFGVPIVVRGEIFGALDFSSSQPQPEASMSSVREALQLMATWLTDQLLKDPGSKYLCSQLCGNHRWLCSDPLPWCVTGKDQPQPISWMKA
jgi:GAF domain-containing protein